jgi:cytidyltransferase-like protein
MKFDNKKKTFVYIGRFQPFHEGHYRLIKSVFKKNDQILILVMDSYGINKKNPFKFSYVKRKILEKISLEFKGRYRIIKIPVVKSIIYGRKVGYKIKRVKLNKNIEKISATNIRKRLNQVISDN